MKMKDNILALTVVLIWGFNFVMIRWGIEDMDPITMTILRFLLTAVPAVFFVKKPDVSMGYIALYGVLFGSGLWGLVNIAIGMGMSAGMASLLLQLSPFLTVLVAVVAFKEVLSIQKVIGIFVALLGFLGIVLINPSEFSSISMVLMLISASVWTLCNTIIKIAKPKNVIAFTVWTSLFVPLPFLCMSLGYVAVSDLPIEPLLQLPSWKGLVSVTFQAFVVTLFGYASWAWLIGKHGLANVAVYSLIVPIAGLFFGWLLYDEVLTLVEMFGSGLVVAGLVLLNLKNSVK